MARQQDCSAGNIRNFRARVLRVLRKTTTGAREGSGYPDAMRLILWSILIGASICSLFVPDTVTAWIRTGTFIALPIVTAASVCVIARKPRNSAAGRLRD